MMISSKEQLVSTLNNLIMTCKDGQEGFHSAGQSVQNTELKKLFHTYAQHCRQLLAELQPEVRNLGGDPVRRGSISGNLHRGWMNLRQVLVDANDAAVVVEAERSEDIMLKSYEEALKEELPPTVRTVISRQYVEVKQVHDRISALKKAQA